MAEHSARRSSRAALTADASARAAQAVTAVGAQLRPVTAGQVRDATAAAADVVRRLEHLADNLYSRAANTDSGLGTSVALLDLAVGQITSAGQDLAEANRWFGNIDATSTLGRQAVTAITDTIVAAQEADTPEDIASAAVMTSQIVGRVVDLTRRVQEHSRRIPALQEEIPHLVGRAVRHLEHALGATDAAAAFIWSQDAFQHEEHRFRAAVLQVEQDPRRRAGRSQRSVHAPSILGI